MIIILPTRLCCGERHWSVECPDGRVMCCICFNRVPIRKLNTLPSGEQEDVCIPCAKFERERMK